MTNIGDVERRTQRRIVTLFRDELGYDYLGDWSDREGNRNIEEEWLRRFLRDTQGYDEALITRALHVFDRAADDTSRSLYDRNRAVYELLRYGVKVKTDVGEHTETVWLIDWKQPERNHFAIAEEVTVLGADPRAHTKRPDIVFYVNGIALGVLELKRSTVSVAEGIRQNLDSQKREFIEHFFSTAQWVMAGNDTEGLRYATIQEYLRQIVELTRQVKNPAAGWHYPKAIDTAGKRALYDNLDQDELLARAVDLAVRHARQDDWRGNQFKVRRVRNAIREALASALESLASDVSGADAVRQPFDYGEGPQDAPAQRVDRILELVKNQHDY